MEFNFHTLSDVEVRVQLALLCATATLEGADIMLLGATFHALSEDLGVRPVQLGALATAQALLVACCGPLWAYLADRQVLSRRVILSVGCLGWGIVTIMLGAMQTFPAMIVLRVINGFFLACLNPVSQGIVCDTAAPEERGRSFGYVSASIQLGQLAATLLAVPLSSKVVFGVRGWRVAYAVVGAVSCLTSCVLACLLKEPHRQVQPTYTDEIARYASWFRIPTFNVIVSQGVFGAVPWNALTFLTMYLQLAGLSEWQTSVIIASGITCNGIGQVIGGQVGDWMERRLPLHGRPFTAQLCFLLGKPHILVLLLVVDPDPRNFPTFLGLTVLFNLFASWCAPAVNRPILAEIVGPEDRSSIFALEYGLEGVSAALFGTMLVGLLAQQVFGYPLDDPHSPTAPGANREKALALGKAVGVVCTVPWTINMILYSMLHITYRRDLMRVSKAGVEWGLTDPLLGKAA